MKKRILKNIEWPVLICTVILIVVGLFAIYSANYSTGGDEFKKQLIWLGVSIPFFLLFIYIDYDSIAKISPILYFISLITLVVVLFTEPISGATSWFVIKNSVSIQPSEFTKIALILFLGLVMSRMKRKGDKEINRISRLALLILIFIVPVLLIIKQPDYGTAAAFVVAFAFMLFMSGIYKRYIFTALIVVVVAVPLLYFYILPSHAKARINVFLNPNSDPRGSGYNLQQSKIAIGAGELTGMGFKEGNQTQLGYLYPKSTDFIFSVIGEEFGFVVSATLIVLYAILITRSITIAKTAKDDLRHNYCIWNCRNFLFPHG